MYGQHQKDRDKEAQVISPFDNISLLHFFLLLTHWQSEGLVALFSSLIAGAQLVALFSSLIAGVQLVAFPRGRRLRRGGR